MPPSFVRFPVSIGRGGPAYALAQGKWLWYTVAKSSVVIMSYTFWRVNCRTALDFFAAAVSELPERVSALIDGWDGKVG